MLPRAVLLFLLALSVVGTSAEDVLVSLASSTNHDHRIITLCVFLGVPCVDASMSCEQRLDLCLMKMPDPLR